MDMRSHMIWTSNDTKGGILSEDKLLLADIGGYRINASGRHRFGLDDDKKIRHHTTKQGLVFKKIWSSDLSNFFDAGLVQVVYFTLKWEEIFEILDFLL